MLDQLSPEETETVSSGTRDRYGLRLHRKIRAESVVVNILRFRQRAWKAEMDHLFTAKATKTAKLTPGPARGLPSAAILGRDESHWAFCSL